MDNTKEKKEHNAKAERFERVSHKDCRNRDTRKETTQNAAKKAKRKISSLAFSLQSAPEFCRPLLRLGDTNLI